MASKLGLMGTSPSFLPPSLGSMPPFSLTLVTYLMRVEALLVHTEHTLGEKVSAISPWRTVCPRSEGQGWAGSRHQCPAPPSTPCLSAELTFPEIDLLETGQGALSPFQGVQACKGRCLFL